MRTKSILVTRTSPVAIIWLARPDIRNAIDGHMVQELDAALASLDADSSVRAVVLAAQGPVFCAGGDVGWMQRMAESSVAVNSRDAHAMASLLQRLDKLRKPTLARVHGAAFAGGLGLIAACDIVVSSLDTDFCVSETRLGLAATTIAPYLVRAMGERQARRYLQTGEVFTAAEAYRIGVVHELVPPEDLDTKVNDVLGHLMLAGPMALPATKEIIGRIVANPDSRKIAVSMASQFAEMRASPEGKEGISAFLEKRRPAWVRTGTDRTSPQKSQAKRRR